MLQIPSLVDSHCKGFADAAFCWKSTHTTAEISTITSIRCQSLIYARCKVSTVESHMSIKLLWLSTFFFKNYTSIDTFKSACFSELLKTPVVSNTSVHLCLSCNLNSHYSSQLLCFFVGGKSRGKDNTAPVRWEVKWNSPLATSNGNSDHNEQCHVHTSIPLLRQCPLSSPYLGHHPCTTLTTNITHR